MIKESYYLSCIDALIVDGGTRACLAMFLRYYRPADPDEQQGDDTTATDNMTSREIRDTLEDICDISLSEVAETMIYLGYRLHINELRGYEWAMRPCPQPPKE